MTALADTRHTVWPRGPAWYVHRARAMTAAEILWRVRDQLRAGLWRRRSQWPVPEIGRLVFGHSALRPVELLSPSEMALLRTAALDIVAGRIEFLNTQVLEPQIDWHRDQASGRQAPRGFALDIPYHDFGIVGNVKNIWEKSRHGHLTVLALAYAVFRDEEFASTVELQLLSWSAANPVLRGVNWASSLELAVRLVGWVWIERLLRGSPVHARLFGPSGSLWHSIYWQQRVIHDRMSHGSSANNHLVGELAGLYVSAMAWPVFRESRDWSGESGLALVDELRRQTFATGLNREQAFGYHLFVLEFVLIALSEDGPTVVHDRLSEIATRMLSAIHHLDDGYGNLPRFGDGDDGMAVQLYPNGGSRVAWIRRASEMLGVSRKEPPQMTSRALEDAGMFMLRSRTTNNSNVYCLVDAGPHGFLSIAAHGHADALSFTLSVEGHRIVIDPGTFTYHGDPKWREYFRGTAAHNTVRVDGEDQCVQGGPFLWATNVRTTVREWQSEANGGRLIASHDGYSRLRGSPVHTRSITLNGDALEVVDELSGYGIHEVEWRLHFAPDCDVRLESGRCLVTPPQSSKRGPSGALTVALDSALSWSIVRGGPDGGWYSPAFNLRVACATLVGRARLTFPLQLHHNLIIT